MITTTIFYAIRESSPPNRPPGSCPVIKVLTDLPAGEDNAFYISSVDLENRPITMTFDHDPKTYQKKEEDLDTGDTISFDIRKGFGKIVLWNGRKIKQHGYAFDYHK